jgi:hypothetical protein
VSVAPRKTITMAVKADAFSLDRPNTVGPGWPHLTDRADDPPDRKAIRQWKSSGWAGFSYRSSFGTVRCDLTDAVPHAVALLRAAPGWFAMIPSLQVLSQM